MNRSSIPNAICVFRILLIVPVVLALSAGNYLLALVLIVIAGVSDGVDGYLAKHFGWRSRLGSLLDPAADKLLLVTTYLSLGRLGLIPWGLTGVVILRDVVIVAGALAYRQLAGHLEGEPTLISKINTGCQLLLILGVLVHARWGLPADGWLLLLGAAVVFTGISSGLNYILVWSRRARLASRAA